MQLAVRWKRRDWYTKETGKMSTIRLLCQRVGRILQATLELSIGLIIGLSLVIAIALLSPKRPRKSERDDNGNP